MATSWGPVEHPTDKKSAGKTIGTATGDVVQPDEHSVTASPKHPTNYDATDGRHSKPNHEGWESVDPHSGEVSDGDWASVTKRFPDGPGPWRQT